MFIDWMNIDWLLQTNQWILKVIQRLNDTL